MKTDFDLAALIARHRSAFSAHLAAIRLADLRNDDDLHDVAARIADEEQAAGLAILAHPCGTLDEVAAKASYILDSELVYDLDADRARLLLGSLIGGKTP